MRKFLIVGVGGSGGATLRYMMDQLRADLRKRDIHALPDAWQFVHVDVNPVPERTHGLGDIRELGGRYVAVSSAGNNFRSVRQTVDSRLQKADRLDSLLGWGPQPRDQAAAVSVTNGAGQYRAVGRMLTLTRLNQIQSELDQAWQALQKATPWGELPLNLAEEGPYNNPSVLPIVVGSMAGGSGASMFLDVCRVMGRISGLSRGDLGVFLFTPDVFSSLDPSLRKGIDGNALGALGELMAAQLRAGDELDNDLLVALGLAPEPENERAFGRAFPIGSFIGGDGAKFGETAEDIYRGLGRALAATVSSENAAHHYQKSKVENKLGEAQGQEHFGWGAAPEEAAWGSFGYASLSLGRDRYAEYAAQRLARTAVDRLVGGYRNPSSTLPPTEQLEQQVANQWPTILDRLQLPGVSVKASEWLRSGPLTVDDQNRVAQKIIDPAWQAIERIEATRNAADWLALVRQGLPAHQPQASQDLEHASYVWAEKFAEDLERRTRAEILRILAHPSQGLPYARKVLDKLTHDVGGLVEKLRKAPPPGESLRLDDGAYGQLAKAELDAQIRERVRQSLRDSVQAAYQASAAHRAAGILTSYAADVLDALHRVVNQALENLDAAMKSVTAEAGLAQLHTTVYHEWPENSERVPPRFDHAQNEVLLTTSAVFPARFREHVEASATGATFASGLGTMVQEIVRGTWENVGAERSDFPVLVPDVEWRAPDLRVDATTGEPRPQSKPRYRLRLATGDLLERALAYQARKDHAFARFSTETFEGYLNENGISDAVRELRRTELVLKFEEAVRQAAPLVGVSAPMVEALHGLPLQIEYTFSTVPLTPGSLAAEDVKALLKRQPNLEQQTLDRFAKALRTGDTSSRIAIFGSYPKYFPLVFSSVLRQLQVRWAGEGDPGQRELWKWKRTRPLPAAVGMSQKEMLAVIKGWYLGRALGLVRHPDEVTSTDPVQVYDLDTKKWPEFDPRGLTPRDTFRNMRFDWLAGVLEAHTLAMVKTVNDQSFGALLPYRALRRIFDDGVQPTDGPPPSGERLITHWLRSGEWPSREPSQIPKLRDGATDAAARAGALRSWLVEARDYVGAEFLTQPAGLGRLAARRPLVPSTQVLDGRPMFAEIALLTHQALEELLASVERASAVPGDGTRVAPQV